MIVELPYKSYKQRVFNKFISGYMLYIIFIVIIFIFEIYKSLIGMIIICCGFFPGILFNIYWSHKENLYFLKKISINEFVELIIFKYDKLYFNQKINFNDINVEFDEDFNSRGGRKFHLIFWYKNKNLHRQYEVGGWDLDNFKQIYKAIREKQNRPAYVDWVKRERWK